MLPALLGRPKAPPTRVPALYAAAAHARPPTPPAALARRWAARCTGTSPDPRTGRRRGRSPAFHERGSPALVYPAARVPPPAWPHADHGIWPPYGIAKVRLSPTHLEALVVRTCIVLLSKIYVEMHALRRYAARIDELSLALHARRRDERKPRRPRRF